MGLLVPSPGKTTISQRGSIRNLDKGIKKKHMEHNKDSPRWIYRTNNISCSGLQYYKRKIVEKQASHACLYFFPEFVNNPNIQLIRYYFKQHVDDEIALRFFTKIRQWWFLNTRSEER